MGLWETTVVTKMTGVDMPAGMPGMGARTTTVRACVTPETWQKAMGSSHENKNCVRSNEVLTTHGYSADITCTQPKATGHVQMTFDSPEKSHGASSMVMTASPGRTMQIDSTNDARFLGAACGDVTPDKPKVVQ